MITAKDVELDGSESYRSVEHLKTLHHVPAGNDKGKTSNSKRAHYHGGYTGQAPLRSARRAMDRRLHR